MGSGFESLAPHLPFPATFDHQMVACADRLGDPSQEENAPLTRFS
jgi:hypothetical protein